MSTEPPSAGKSTLGDATWPTLEDRVEAAARSYIAGESNSLPALAEYFGVDPAVLERHKGLDNWELKRRHLREESGSGEPDRMPDGRFRTGHGIKSPGRPRRSEEASWLDLLREEVTPPRWIAVVRKALEQALRGDARARAWLGDYLLPRKEALPAPDRRVELVYETLATAIGRMEREEKLQEAEGKLEGRPARGAEQP